MGQQGTVVTRPRAHAAATSGMRISQPQAEKGADQVELAAVAAACAAGRPLVHRGSSAAAQTAACGRLCVIVGGSALYDVSALV